ncbi:MAG: carboxylesterase/lipase family protein [Frankia sp.]
MVTTTNGAVRGKASADHREFLAIPFAAPPTGQLRFRPPSPTPSWTGVRDATKPGPVCPQSLPLGTVSEDCLQLNVFTPPAAESRNLPVMVWFHGGGYVFGSAYGYNPTPLVTQGKVIVVTVNYRFGPFGYLALPQLAAESNTTGNYGVLDQQAALRWVRANIASFGGNPRNVTIFGESAGGHSVCMQLISPSAAGLFAKAISESGGCVGTALGPVTTQGAYTTGENLAKAVGCTDPATVVSCLRGKPLNDLLKAGGGGLSSAVSWLPTIDGTVIKEPPRDALTSGRYNHVPMIVGTNANEGRLFAALFYHLQKLRHANQDDLRQEIQFRAGKLTQALLDTYRPASATNADLATAAVTTDGAFACPALFTVRAAKSNPGQVVYQYEFADPNAPLSNLDPFMNLGDYHASELFYLFATVQGVPSLLNNDQKRLSRQMTTYWTTFARTGNPNGLGTPTWPVSSGTNPQVQRLTSRGTAPFTDFAPDHDCALWS